MTAVELFAGIGGFRVACERLGIETVWANDIDAKAAKVYTDNFGHDVFHVGDIRKLKGDIPPHDILTGGFPCQPFSKAGKKQGVDDYRGTLFEEIVDVVRRNKPRHFVLENVANLLSLNDGSHFRTILSALSSLGYMVEWKVFDATKLGLPQHRLRVVIVGTRGMASPLSYLLTECEARALNGKVREAVNDFSRWGRVVDIWKKLPNWGMACDGKYVAGSVVLQEQLSPPKKLTDVLEDGVPPEFDFTDDMQTRLADSVFINKLYDGVRILYNQGGGARMGYTVFGTDGVAPTLTASASRHYERYFVNGRFRRLTNVEYARIQGFRDDHCKAVSVYDQYKLFGNALPPDLAFCVLERIVKGGLVAIPDEEDLFTWKERAYAGEIAS